MTRLLALETSSEACSVALRVDGETRELHEHAPMRHAELLLPAISSLLAEAGMKVSDLDAIAFGRGPGSFTSLRIGIGVVQGLAWAADVGVVPCSSLAAVAYAAVNRAGGFSGQVCVAVDARMQEVFSAEFTGAGGGPPQPAGAERVCAAGAVPRPDRGRQRLCPVRGIGHAGRRRLRVFRKPLAAGLVHRRSGARLAESPRGAPCVGGATRLHSQ